MTDAYDTVPTPEVVYPDVSTCPYCGKQQQEPRRQWVKCDNNEKCSRCFPAVTWLFMGYDPINHEHVPDFNTPSESFTTAIFALYLLDLDGNKKFPIRIVVGPRYECRHDGELNLSGLVFHQLGIELHGRPDLIIRSRGRQEVHIENKPWAAEGRGHESSVSRIQEYRVEARQRGADFYVLISCGNPQDQLWKWLAEKKVPVILWEEVLLRMDRAKFAMHLAPKDTPLKLYYETYVRS